MELEDGDKPIGLLKAPHAEAIVTMLFQQYSMPLVSEIWNASLSDQPSQCFCGSYRVYNKAADNLEGTKPTYCTNTMYKRKAQKVQPVDNAPSDGSVPEGDQRWREKKWADVKDKLQYGSKFDKYTTPKFSDIPEKSRLTDERLEAMLQGSADLTPQEKELLLHVLLCREAALAWEFSHAGRIDPMIAPPQEIRTVPYKAWQTPGVPIPKPMVSQVVELLKERVTRGILENGYRPYRNAWFLVKKKDGRLRLINNATKYNAVTIRDADMPPNADSLSEEFGMCIILILADLFSGYNQVPLAIKSCDLTAFQTPIGLLRMCTLPQGATNSVAQFIRVITRIIKDLVPNVCRAFLDDLCIKGPTTDYSGEELEPGLRRYIVEHI